MSELPEWYIEWIPRISNIVEFYYPFWGYAEDNYKKWLKSHWIEEEEYLEEAQNVWTFVHLQIEKSILWEKLDIKDELYDKHSLTIEHWLDFAESLSKQQWDLMPEVVVHDNKNRYQWTIDLVRIDEKTKTVWLYDWKTWWIAKERYWLKNEAKKPVDKLKKVALQLSLYAETYRQKGYSIWWIYVVWVHKTWTYAYSLFEEDNRQKYNYIRLWTSDELDTLLEEFYLRQTKLPPKITLKINFTEMKIEVQTTLRDSSWKEINYSKGWVIIEENDLPTGTSVQDRINYAIETQKTLINSYSKTT